MNDSRQPMSVLIHAIVNTFLFTVFYLLFKNLLGTRTDALAWVIGFFMFMYPFVFRVKSPWDNLHTQSDDN